MKQKLLYLFLVISISCSSQNRKRFFYGKIIDSTDVVINAHVINLKTKQGTFSDQYGFFKIYAKENDSLQITSIGYKTKKIRVQLFQFREKINLIFIESKTYNLEEIKLKRNNLLGILETDLNTVPKKTIEDVDAISLGLPGAGMKKMEKQDREIYTATTSAGGISFDYFLNVLSGRLKKLKKKKKIIEENQDINFIYKKYHLLLFQNFKIKKEDTYKFLDYCVTDSLYKKSLLKNEFELIKFLETKSKLFIAYNYN